MPECQRKLNESPHRWGRRPENSGRSVLVTILGDTVVPLGGAVWLSDLIALARPFGFSERLVRTSMFRLVGERWVGNERSGRRSRYVLTDFGREEFATAESRIYRQPKAEWDGTWTLVIGVDGRDELAKHLRWHGFAELADGVLASPSPQLDRVRQLLDGLSVATRPLVARARFDDIAALTRFGSFRETSGLSDADGLYQEFVKRYRWTESLTADELAAEDAFALRTMLIHDLRRARLRDPDLPADLLPDPWSGTAAVRLAASAYARLGEGSWRWVETVTGLQPDLAGPELTNRFASMRSREGATR